MRGTRLGHGGPCVVHRERRTGSRHVAALRCVACDVPSRSRPLARVRVPRPVLCEWRRGSPTFGAPHLERTVPLFGLGHRPVYTALKAVF